MLTRNCILSLNYQALTDQGYLQSPYREVVYLRPGAGKGWATGPQVYPGTHTSNAASADLKYYLPYRAALDGFYRFYTDTWGIAANTLQLGYTQPWQHWIFDGTLRYYQQNAANFYGDLFPRANAQNFMARDRELAAFSSYTVGVGAAYDFQIPRSAVDSEEHAQSALRPLDDRLHRLPRALRSAHQHDADSRRRDRCVASLSPRRQYHSAFLLPVLLTLMPRLS